jgi:ParB family transcriptional regulator, chromosome partitioning protein
VVKKALGRGLESLIPRKVLEERRGSAQQIPLGKIKPNPFQPRKLFKSEDLQELVTSIQERGVLQPILVRRKGDGWELIAGERRFRACQKLGLLTVPAIEVAAADVEVLELALVENLQRSDLAPLEEAEGYHRLKEEFGLTQEQIAHQVGKERATVANALRLLNLSPEVKELLASGRLSAGHARAVAALETPLEQKRLADKIIQLELSVRDAEKMAQGTKGARKTKAGGKPKDPNVLKLEEDLRHWLRTKVSVQTKGRHKGTICLDYYSLEDLDRILALFRRAGLR